MEELAAELLGSNRVKKCREGTKGTATLLDVVDGPFALGYGKRIEGAVPSLAKLVAEDVGDVDYEDLDPSADAHMP